jgi:hypothetical protein
VKPAARAELALWLASHIAGLVVPTECVSTQLLEPATSGQPPLVVCHPCPHPSAHTAAHMHKSAKAQPPPLSPLPPLPTCSPCQGGPPAAASRGFQGSCSMALNFQYASTSLPRVSNLVISRLTSLLRVVCVEQGEARGGEGLGLRGTLV